jgi:hypothetical protein
LNGMIQTGPMRGVDYHAIGLNEGPAIYSEGDAFQGMGLELAYPWTEREGDNIRLMWTTDCGLTLEFWHIPFQFN